MDICALIMARGGSKRVPNKNIRPFAYSSLLELKIDQLTDEELTVYVNSDSDEILEIANLAGAKCIKREPQYATDDVSINDVYKNLAQSVEHEHVLFAHATSPLVSRESLIDCLSRYGEIAALDFPEYDSLATVTYLHKFLWFEDMAINYDPSEMPRSQDLPDYYILNFAFNILPRQLMIDSENIVGKNFYPYELNELEAYDVDTEVEFRIAESIYTDFYGRN